MTLLDVFLTTMKPQQKVVTASDVQSSLYYVHVDSPDDEGLLSSSDLRDSHDSEEVDFKESTFAGNTAGVRRKPLPLNSHRPEPPPKIYPHCQLPTYGQNSVTQVGRKPVGHSSRPAHRSLDTAPVLPPRSLLGPRPLKQRLHSTDSSTLPKFLEKQDIDLRKWPKQPTAAPLPLPPRSHANGETRYGLPYENSPSMLEPPNEPTGKFSRRSESWQSEYSANLRVDNKEKHNTSRKLSLSLIRRYDGQQWNVGKISDKLEDSTMAQPAHAGGGLSVELMTPGYAKFISGSSQKVQVDNGIPSWVPFHPEDRISHSDQDFQEKVCQDKVVFQRHLEISSKLKRLERRRMPNSSDPTLSGEVSRQSIELQAQDPQDSIDIKTTDSMQTQSTELTIASSKGYILQSPWNGVCEFTTGVAGRSLKCKHRATTFSGAGSQSASVSELRFNLPSSKTFGSPAPKSPLLGTPRESKRSSFFAHHQNRRYSSSFEAQENGLLGSKVEFADRLDLSLGQEHAGGGFGGKQAKLGKLIIEREGLQMLDLVVAANMALWWRVYERYT